MAKDAQVIRSNSCDQYALLIRAIRTLARHGVPLVVMSQAEGNNAFEIDGVPVREIDVIMRATVLDRRLFSQVSSLPANGDQRAA